MPGTLIATDDALKQHLQASGGEQTGGDGQPQRICAIDTEADSLHRYRESLCLVQFAYGKDCVLFDPLAISDLSPLGAYLEKATVWMHGADYDMTMLKREFGKLPRHVYDTQIGARLLGVRRFGLGDLVLHYFGVQLSKSSQKADWGKRPLSPVMVEYALNDVRYLLEMGEKISAELHEKHRFGWFLESCEAARQKILTRDQTREEAWRIQGSGKLSPYALACLRGLWQWRDEQAKAWDRPSFMVLPSRVMMEWVLELSENRGISPPPHLRSEALRKLKAAIDEIESSEEDSWPARPVNLRKKRTKDFEKQVEELIKTREKAAAELGIEGSLLGSRAVLEALVESEAEPATLLLSWQRECLGL